MKREIKFRGLRLDGNGWVYGDLLSRFKMTLLHNVRNGRTCYEVITPESVGQFTGLQDKNGVDTYDHDIIKYLGKIYEIRYFDSAYGFFIDDVHHGWISSSIEFEVIGNIHQSK